MNTNPKITASHLSRTAVVYLRQSSAAQVRDHGESTSRQYALADQAVSMGWPRRDIEVIDADLGLSGRTIEHRRGLRELMARVGLGEIGAIFVLEVSRLARSSADFQRLLDFARLADALLIDTDGVYDLRDFNDRLLLGLKGTMSEVELHLMAGRLRGGQDNAAARGALRKQLPIGYLYDPDGQVVIDPDAEVQTAVADVFACFAAAGSAHGVLKAFRGRRFPARIVSGPDAGQLLTPLPPAAELAALVGDVHSLWHAETTTARDRKRLLRTLIADVTILPETDRSIVRVGVRWHSGATDTLTLPRPQAPRTPQAALDLIRRLGPTTDNQTLADLLNQQGQRTAHGHPFTPNTVQCIRYDHHIAPAATPPPSPPGRLTVTELADHPGIRPATVYDWIRHDVVKTDRSGRHILILCDPETEDSLRVRIANQPRIKHTNPTSTTRRAVCGGR